LNIRAEIIRAGIEPHRHHGQCAPVWTAQGCYGNLCRRRCCGSRIKQAFRRDGQQHRALFIRKPAYFLRTSRRIRFPSGTLADVNCTNPWARRTPPDRRARKSLAGSLTGTWGELLLTHGASSEWRRLMIVSKTKQNFSTSMDVGPQMMREASLAPISSLRISAIAKKATSAIRVRIKCRTNIRDGRISGTTIFWRLPCARCRWRTSVSPRHCGRSPPAGRLRSP
jgi:hypothetical protein